MNRNKGDLKSKESGFFGFFFFFQLAAELAFWRSLELSNRELHTLGLTPGQVCDSKPLSSPFLQKCF